MKKVKLLVTFLLCVSFVALLSCCVSSQEAFTKAYKQASGENLSKDNF